MNNYIQVLAFVIIAIVLLWLGLSLYIRFRRRNESPAMNTGSGFESVPEPNTSWAERWLAGKKKHDPAENPGKTKTCPVCSAALPEGEQVKTTAFPALNNSKDRLMHIHGCVYCLGNFQWKSETGRTLKNKPLGSGGRKRFCPVCKSVLGPDDYLAARIFDRALRNSHVHILGCPNCRKLASGGK